MAIATQIDCFYSSAHTKPQPPIARLVLRSLVKLQITLPAQRLSFLVAETQFCQRREAVFFSDARAACTASNGHG